MNKPITILLFVGLVQIAFAWWLRSKVARIAVDVVAPTRDLAHLRGLLERLEAEPFESPRLAALRLAFDVEGLPPSKRIRQLQRLTDLLDARRNQLFAPFSARRWCSPPWGSGRVCGSRASLDPGGAPSPTKRSCVITRSR